MYAIALLFLTATVNGIIPYICYDNSPVQYMTLNQNFECIHDHVILQTNVSVWKQTRIRTKAILALQMEVNCKDTTYKHPNIILANANANQENKYSNVILEKANTVSNYQSHLLSYNQERQLLISKGREYNTVSTELNINDCTKHSNSGTLLQYKRFILDFIGSKFTVLSPYGYDCVDCRTLQTILDNSTYFEYIRGKYFINTPVQNYMLFWNVEEEINFYTYMNIKPISPYTLITAKTDIEIHADGSGYFPKLSISFDNIVKKTVFYIVNNEYFVTTHLVDDSDEFYTNQISWLQNMNYTMHNIKNKIPITDVNYARLQYVNDFKVLALDKNLHILCSNFNLLSKLVNSACRVNPYSCVSSILNITSIKVKIINNIIIINYCKEVDSFTLNYTQSFDHCTFPKINYTIENSNDIGFYNYLTGQIFKNEIKIDCKQTYYININNTLSYVKNNTLHKLNTPIIILSNQNTINKKIDANIIKNIGTRHISSANMKDVYNAKFPIRDIDLINANYKYLGTGISFNLSAIHYIIIFLVIIIGIVSIILVIKIVKCLRK